MLEAKNWIKKVYWADVRDQVAAVNPEFAAEVDKLSPGKDLPLYEAGYSFGQLIVKSGVLQLPTDQGLVEPISSSAHDPNVQADLSYAPNMPLGIVMDKTIQFFMQAGSKFSSYRCYLPSKLFALWPLLQPEHTSSNPGGGIIQISSGTRSLVMLPKLSASASYKRLRKKFGLKNPEPPFGLEDQWPLFVDLANSAKFEDGWATKLLFLSRKWFQKLKEPGWLSLRHYLLATAWMDTSFLRDEYIYNFAFSKALEAKNLRPDPYLADTVKNLYYLDKGIYPSYKIATDDMAAPIINFQEIFNEVYDLEYAPTMMHFAHMNPAIDINTLYYSLEIPALQTFSPKSRKAINKLMDLREIKHIQQATQDYFMADELNLKTVPLYQMITEANFEYFHSKTDGFKDVQNARELPQLDKVLADNLNKFSKKSFCYSSMFLNGCIKISI